MPGIEKVREHSSTSDNIIYHETSADIVKVNNSEFTTIKGTDAQSVVNSIDGSIKTTNENLTKTANTINQTITNNKNAADNKFNEVDKSISDTNKRIDETIHDVSTHAKECTYKTKIVATKFGVLDGHYGQKIEIEGIKETDNPIIGIVLSDDTNLVSDEMEAWGCIQRVTCGDGFITVHCYDDTPLVDINIQLKVIH